MNTHTKALLAIVVAAILWASAGATAKLLFQEAPPLVVAFHRFFLASLLILPFFLRAKKSKNYFRILLPLGIFNALNILFYYSGLAKTTANTSTIIGTAVPLTTAIFSQLFIGEKISAQKLIGICVGLIGTLFIVLLPMIEKGQTFSGSITGNVLLILSLISWTFYIVYSRSILSQGNHSPVVSTSINIFTVTTATFVATLVSRQPVLNIALTVPSYLAVLFYAAVGITVITFFLFQWGVQHVSASTASLKEYLQLLIGVGINAVILGETLTVTYLLGGALVGIGVFIATTGSLTKKFAALLFTEER